MDHRSERVLQRYLGEIESELERLPRTNRREITAEIRSHLIEEWRRCGEQTEENLLNIINRFGEPREIAAGYLEEHSGRLAPGETSYPPSWLVIVLTVFIWPAGIILAWLSPAWKTRDKLIATLIPLFLFFLVLAGGIVNFGSEQKTMISEKPDVIIQE